MKNAILALLLAVSTQSGYAQKCDYKVKKDELRETKRCIVVMEWSTGMGLFFVKAKTGYYLKVEFNKLNMQGKNVVDADTPLVLELTNNQALSLAPVDPTKSRLAAFPYPLFAVLTSSKWLKPTYNITQEQVELLRLHGLQRLQMSFKNERGEIISKEYQVKPKYNKKLMRYAACILQ